MLKKSIIVYPRTFTQKLQTKATHANYNCQLLINLPRSLISLLLISSTVVNILSLKKRKCFLFNEHVAERETISRLFLAVCVAVKTKTKQETSQKNLAAPSLDY